MSSSDPAPVSTMAKPAVACGTKTLHRPSPRPAQKDRTSSGTSTVRRRVVSTSSTSVCTPTSVRPASQLTSLFIPTPHGYCSLTTHPLEEDMTITGVITAILIGIVVGVLGRLVVPGKQHISVLVTV